MLRKRAPSNLEFSYRIYAPSGRHKSFRILKLFKDGSSESIESEALQKVNAALKSMEISEAEARNHVEKIRDDLYAAAGIKNFAIVFNSDNRKILNAYWESEYKPRLINLEDPNAALSELKRSVDAVGAVSLRSGSRNELQAALDQRLTGNLQRRAVGKLNSILKFIGRDFRLIRAKKEYPEVKYVTPEEFRKLVQAFEDEKIRLLHIAAFATGMRLGELMAMESRLYNRNTNTIKVLSQIDKKGKKRKTKNRKNRTAFVFPEFKSDVERWLQVQPEFEHEIRLRISRFTRKACKASLKNKTLKFHDMRHSYAINLLSKGVPLSHVAQCLGDSIAVAEEFYTGFDLSTDAVSLINNIVSESHNGSK